MYTNRHGLPETWDAIHETIAEGRSEAQIPQRVRASELGMLLVYWEYLLEFHESFYWEYLLEYLLASTKTLGFS
jgi:hypothetical protein